VRILAAITSPTLPCPHAQILHMHPVMNCAFSPHSAVHARCRSHHTSLSNAF